MTETTVNQCPGCGARIERRRKWCSDNCRKKTTYGGTCETCGATTSYVTGGAAKHCRACDIQRLAREGNARARAEAQRRRERIARLWRAGLTAGQIADHIGSTPKSVAVAVVRMRQQGWDMPYHYAASEQRRAA